MAGEHTAGGQACASRERAQPGRWQRRLPGRTAALRGGAARGTRHVALLPPRDCRAAERIAGDSVRPLSPLSRGRVTRGSREGGLVLRAFWARTPCGWPSVPTFRVCAPSPTQLGPGLAPRAPARPPLCVAADGRDGVGGHRAHRRVPAAAQAPGALHPLHRPGDLPALPLLRHQRTYRSAPPDHAS